MSEVSGDENPSDEDENKVPNQQNEIPAATYIFTYFKYFRHKFVELGLLEISGSVFKNFFFNFRK